MLGLTSGLAALAGISTTACPVYGVMVPVDLDVSYKRPDAHMPKDASEHSTSDMDSGTDTDAE